MNKTHDVIGILGGTFDPIHYGHLRMGQEILDAHALHSVHFVPCYQPVHRHEPLADPKKRLDMLQMAIQSQPQFVADEREINRKSPSYTVDTLLSLRDEMPHTTLCLLIGSDAFLDYPRWHEPHHILELAHIIVAHRPNYQLPATGDLIDFMKKYQTNDATLLRKKQAGCIFFQPITALDISAKLIRGQLAMHQSPRYLLPDNVYNYIRTNQLYLTK